MKTLRQLLLDKHCNPSLYDVFVDEHEGVATFFLYSVDETVIGYSIFSPWKKVKRKKEHGLFGVETLSRPGYVFLVEDKFDAVRLHNEGFAAIAVNRSSMPFISEQLGRINRKKVAVCTPGPSGNKLKRFGKFVIMMPENFGRLSELTSSQMKSFMKQPFMMKAQDELNQSNN